MSEPIRLPVSSSAALEKDGRIRYDSTDLNSNNFSVDQELFLREIKEEPASSGDESQDTLYANDFCGRVDKEGKRTVEGQTWFVTIKREACIEEQDTTVESPKSVKKPHVCNDCGKAFKHNAKLARHLISHGLADSFTCDLCGKTFNRKDVLLKHISSVHFFGVEFLHPSNYETQSNNISIKNEFNNSMFPFSCDVCHKTFKRFDSVKRHKRAHFNERDFVCHLCDMKFTQTSILTRHIRSHTKETPFSCGMCNKKYTRKYILARHIVKKHSKKISYICDRCNKKFQSEGYLRKHMRQMHKVTLSS